MIKYPNKKNAYTNKFHSTSNRGMNLESMINQTNEFYLDEDIAVIYKKPIPIQIVNVDYKQRSAAKIVEAYYKTPSTTDFNGIYKGRYIDFDAKETNSKTSMPLKNIHLHQIEHLKQLLKQYDFEVSVTTENFKPGKKVEIIAGPMIGLRGELIEHRGNNKFILRFEHINSIFTVEVPASQLSLLPEN